MKSLVENTKDLRYMRFPSVTSSRTDYLNNQINGINGNFFIEVYRKNGNQKRNVVSIREKRNVVNEILIYNNDNQRVLLLYLKKTLIQ